MWLESHYTADGRRALAFVILVATHTYRLKTELSMSRIVIIINTGQLLVCSTRFNVNTIFSFPKLKST